MLSLKLAFRGLWRHKIRTIITLSAVAFGHCLGVVFVSMNDGGHELMIELGVRQGRAGHVVVQAEGYQRSQSVELLVPNPGALKEQIRSALPEAVITSRVFGGGLARTAAEAVGILFAGVEPPTERQVNDVVDRIVKGVYLGADEQAIAQAERRQGGKDTLWCARPPGPDEPLRRQVIVGAQLAKTLRLDLCDGLVIDAQGMGSRESMRFLVVGIFQWNSPDLDSSFVSMRLSDAQQMLHLGVGVHQVAVFVASIRDTARADQQVRAIVDVPMLEVLTWDRAMPEMAEFIWLDEASGYIFMVIVYLIIGIGILNTMLMSVMERTRELGVMRALGMGPWRIVSQVLGEGALIGLLGVILGGLTAIYPAYYLQTTGIDMQQFSESAMEMGGVAMTVLKGKLYFSSALWATLGIFGMAVAAAIYPAVRAARMPVLRAIQQH